MASSLHYSFRKSIYFSILLFLFSSFLVSVLSESTQLQRTLFLTRRRMLGEDIEEVKPKKKPNLVSTSKNQTKLIKPNLISSKNQTKLIKPTTVKTSNSTKSIHTNLSNTLFKKLNSTLNSTKLNDIQSKKTSDLSKLNTPKNKTQPIITKQLPKQSKSQIQEKPKPQKAQKPEIPDWMDLLTDEVFIAEFRDLPSKFHETLIPDLERISKQSKAYMSKANKEISEGFRPLVGKHYAPTIASVLSCVFILLPLLLVSLVFNRIKAYFPLQTILIFIQIYLSIYFFILALSAMVTGLEPLKFFYATSMSSYICLQVLQTLGYVLFLLLLLMNLVLVFSTESGLGSKTLALGQTIVGCAVGLHYYVAVFHRAILHQSPKTNWKVHGIYATCFLVICLFAKAETRKKAYLEYGGEEGKKS